MIKKRLAGCVLFCLICVMAGYVVLDWTPDQRVGYGLMAFGIIVLVIGFVAEYVSDS